MEVIKSESNSDSDTNLSGTRGNPIDVDLHISLWEPTPVKIVSNFLCFSPKKDHSFAAESRKTNI
jgi:hypothetical protein